MKTGVKGLRLRELGKAAERFLGQSQQQFGNDYCDMVMAGKCLGSTGCTKPCLQLFSS